MSSYYFTSESVSEGHPDKICDRISDSILDLYLSKDKHSRTAIETAVTTDFVCIMGETRGPDEITNVEMEQAARDAIKDIGYNQKGFSWKTAKFDIRVHSQSSDIAQGVDGNKDNDKDEGAGDQGIMFGYACKETDVLMPAPIYYAHKILKVLADARHAGKLPELEPDAKSQVTLKYVDGKPVKAGSIVLSTQHKDGLSQNDIKELVRPYIADVLPDGWMCDEDRFFVNPTGRFVIGGPVGDAGLTGRKIIVDTYGGSALHGGGAFSGKDPTKVDRSAAYASRYLAKNIVAADYADKCTIQLSYAIGVSQPISIYVSTHGTGRVDKEKLYNAISEIIDLSPRGIRKHLELNKPIYTPTSSYGHFGRTPTDEGHFSWEKTDLVDKLKSIVG